MKYKSANVNKQEVFLMKAKADLLKKWMIGALSAATVPCGMGAVMLGIVDSGLTVQATTQWENSVILEGSCGENISFQPHDDGSLVVKGAGAMKDYGISGSPFYRAYQKGYPIKRIIVEENMTHIGKYAFGYLKDVLQVILPESLESIGIKAFGYDYDSQTKQSTKIKDFYLKGYADSAVQTYAAERKFRFYRIGGSFVRPSMSRYLWISGRFLRGKVKYEG